MTEYDYSPEAYERYLTTQNRIARWVDNTQQYQPRNPFTPATPAVKALQFEQAEGDYYRKDGDKHRRRHHRHHKSSSGQSSPPRHRSSSYSYSGQNRPPPTRSQTAPAQNFARHDYQSRHSSRSSSTTRPHSASTTHFSHYPPPPRRSQTTPYHTDKSSGYTTVYAQTGQPIVFPIQNGASGYVTVPPHGHSHDMMTAQQIPFTAYQPVSPTKSQPLLKRLFINLTGGSKSSKSRRSRSSSIG